MYAEFEVHRTMIRDRVRTEAFRRAIDSVVRPGDMVLDVGAGSGILSVFAARAGAESVYTVERHRSPSLPRAGRRERVAEIVHVIHGDVMEVELPGQVNVIVSEWLGGLGIDEGMLAPVIAARDRWLKPGRVMIPRSVTAWTALVHDRYLAETVGSCGTTRSASSSRSWSKRPSTRSSIPAPSVTSRRMTGAPSRVGCGPRTRAG